MFYFLFANYQENLLFSLIKTTVIYFFSHTYFLSFHLLNELRSSSVFCLFFVSEFSSLFMFKNLKPGQKPHIKHIQLANTLNE